MKVDVILTADHGHGIAEIPIGKEEIQGRSMNEIRFKLERWACRKFGRMERGEWRMVADQTVFGLYARNQEGETIRFQ